MTKSWGDNMIRSSERSVTYSTCSEGKGWRDRRNRLARKPVRREGGREGGGGGGEGGRGGGKGRVEGCACTT